MGQELVNDAKDCCKEDAGQQQDGFSFLSILESAGKSVASGIKAAEDFGSGAIRGAADAVGVSVSKETADSVARGAVMLGIGGVGALALDQAVKNPAKTAAVAAGGAIGAAALELLKDSKAANQVSDCARDAAIGAAIGATAGLATGDATRAVTLAAMGAITGAAARCAAECACGPACCIKPGDPVSMMKDLGKAVLDHVKNRPLEAAAEAVVAGVPGVVGGAMLRKMMENKGCCDNLCEKAMKNAGAEIKRQAEILKKVIDPLRPPVIEMGPLPIGGPVSAPLEPVIQKVAQETAKQVANEVVHAQKEIAQHRKDNPVTSKIERVVGGPVGGPVIEYADVKARQAYKYVKSWFE